MNYPDYDVECFMCNTTLPVSQAYIEEGDLWACEKCVKAWEQKHQRHWCNGRPFGEEPKIDMPYSSLPKYQGEPWEF